MVDVQGNGGKKMEDKLKNGYKPKLQIPDIVAFFAVLIAIGMHLWRITKGADITDESFYSTISYSILKGNAYLKDTWEQCSTFTIIPTVFLAVYSKITGGIDGIILFMRMMYFVVNCLVAATLYSFLRQYLRYGTAAIIAVTYLIYSPFQIYTFSYNNLSDMFLVLTISLLGLASAKVNGRYYVAAGVATAFMALSYPPMLFFACAMVVWLFLNNRRERGAFFSYAAGGMVTAAVIVIILCITIGPKGITTGLKGILEDPIYNGSDINVLTKFKDAVLVYLKPILDKSVILIAGLVVLVIAGLISIVAPSMRMAGKLDHPDRMKTGIPKAEFIRLVPVIWPILVFIAFFPPADRLTYVNGLFAFFVSFPAPFMPVFTKKYKEQMADLVRWGWVPSFISYLVISISSFGGAIQAVHALIGAEIVFLAEVALLIRETFEIIIDSKRPIEDSVYTKSRLKAAVPEEAKAMFGSVDEEEEEVAPTVSYEQREEAFTLAESKFINICIAVTVVFLALNLFCKFYVNCSVLYRDDKITTLTSKIEKGPYKGLYTSKEKKEYLDWAVKNIGGLSEKDKTCLVLYHSNFAYLMLDMKPCTPTTWGLYPSKDNQGAYFKYFSQGVKYVPDYIYVVNVPKNLDVANQNENKYRYANELRGLISTYYKEDASIKYDKKANVTRYVLNMDKLNVKEYSRVVYEDVYEDKK